MNFQAVIFDLDGTIILNEEVYAEAFKEVLRNHGVSIDGGTTIPHTPGIGMERNWELLKKDFNLPEDLSLSVLSHETQNSYHKRIKEVIVRPGFYELQESLVDNGIFLALATSNNWWLVEDELAGLDLQKYFNVTVTREEVFEPKPEPDIFFKAAEKLSIEPEDCIVIEDSIAGIKAAKEAGMKAVAVLGSYSSREDFPDADLVVEGFEEVTPEILDALCQPSGQVV